MLRCQLQNGEERRRLTVRPLSRLHPLDNAGKESSTAYRAEDRLRWTVDSECLQVPINFVDESRMPLYKVGIVERMDVGPVGALSMERSPSAMSYVRLWILSDGCTSGVIGLLP